MAHNLRARSGIQVENLGPLDREETKGSSSRENQAGWSGRKILAVLLVFRWLNVALVQTSFVPDEYWQSLEVAHHMAFGYGHLTWEWRAALRGYAYPAIFAALYKLLAFLQLDFPLALILTPRFLQATLSAIGDYCLYKVSCDLHGKNVGKWTLIMNLSSWYVFYSATRTLTNTTEAALTSVGLYHFPWPEEWLVEDKRKEPSGPRMYVVFVALACLVRPTAAVLWLPLCLWHVNFSRTTSVQELSLSNSLPSSLIIAALDAVRVMMVLFLPVGLGAILLSLLIDRVFYGEWVFVQKNFVEFNLIHDLGAFYGSHSWHWYFSQGFPVVMTTHIPSFLMGAKMGYKKNGILLLVVLWTLFVYSFASHKEFRFIYPVVPICMLFCGLFMEDMYRRGQSRLLILYLLLNVPACIYFGLFHQRGVLDVMGYVRHIAGDRDAGQEKLVFFLMPCHSTPYRSFVHDDLPMRFLECPPNLHREDDYMDESSLFYSNPSGWLKEEYPHSHSAPMHLIFFDVLRPSIEEFLTEHKFTEVANYFHTHLPEGKVGSRILVFARRGGWIPYEDR